jgi:hypothetical protein
MADLIPGMAVKALRGATLRVNSSDQGLFHKKLSMHFLLKAIIVLSIVGAILLSGTSVSAKDLYVSQNGGGGGTNCNDTLAASWFNSSSNWGAGTAQIGPGTTVHLCGTITTALTAQGSGSNGSPITIKFETGAKILVPVCPQTGCMTIQNLNYIIVDGGTACGWISMAIVPCNGQIASTASVSNWASGSVVTNGIEALNCAFCEIRNLRVGPIWVALANTSTSSAGPVGIAGIQSGGITTPGGTFLVHNIELDDAGDGIDYFPQGTNDNGFQFYNNYAHNNAGHVIIANTNNGDLTAALIHDNNLGATANWDSVGCTSHTNTLHAWAYTTFNSGIQFYNNVVGGDRGSCATAEIFIEGAGADNRNCSVYNNVFNGTYTQMNNGIVNINCTGFIKYFNNTIIGAKQGGDIGLIFGVGTSSPVSLFVANNIITNVSTTVDSKNSGSTTYALWNNNVYGQDPSGTGWVRDDIGQFYTFPQWQVNVPADTHSSANGTANYVLINGNGSLQTGSPAIGKGTNLSSLGIVALNSDITGAPRPNGTTTAWDIGAYFSNGSAMAPPPGPNPPSGLAGRAQ